MWFGSSRQGSPSFDGAERFRPAADVVAARHGDDTVLLSVDTGRYYTLNEVGTRIWELLPAGATVDGLVDVLQSEYEAPREDIARDTGELIARLEAAKLIRRA